MLAILKAIDPFPRQTNAPKKKSSTGTLLGFKRLNSSLLNASRTSRRWIGLGKTIITIIVIEKAVVIVALAA